MITIKKSNKTYSINEKIRTILLNLYGFNDPIKVYFVSEIKSNRRKRSIYGAVDTIQKIIYVKESSIIQMNITLWHEIGHILYDNGYSNINGERKIEAWARKIYKEYGNLIEEK